MKKNIVIAIISLLTFTIGAIWLPVSTLICAPIVAGSVIMLTISIVSIIKQHLANKETVNIRTRVPVKDIIMTVMAVIIVIILIMLLCKGCTPVNKVMDEGIKLPELPFESDTAEDSEVKHLDILLNSLHVNNLIVGNAKVEKQEVETQIVDTQEVDEQKVEKQEIATPQETPKPVEKPVTPVVHTHSYVITREEATCQKDGKEVETCSCGDTKTTKLPKLDHSIAKENKVNATCDNDGKIERLCSCGKVIGFETLKAEGHRWDDGKVTVEATENKTGELVKTCKVCGATDTVTLEKLKKPAHNHDYFWEVAEEATCEEEGVEEYVCKCGDVLLTRDIEKLEHEWNEGKVKVEATENKTGKLVKTCKVCGATDTVILEKLKKPAHNHDYFWKVTEEATCEEEGVKEYVCKCGDVLRTRDIEKLEHHYEQVDQKAPTSTKDGYIKYSCNNCGDSYKETIPATGEEESTNKAVYLKPIPYQSYLEAGVEITIVTTGSTSNLEISYDPDVVEYKIVDDKKVTVKWNGKSPTAVSIWDNTADNEESVLDLTTN